ncbi:homeotic protein proboscipedia-like [Ceratitis capitata]|uniref:homeotic protein proboscipedia-like n=1 Tax=Ceratitis capitata TaxID=7213 RepID=UPI000C6C7600|nr:homeotic protein proboscipedia-like [Ceratitis capitata]
MRQKAAARKRLNARSPSLHATTRMSSICFACHLQPKSNQEKHGSETLNNNVKIWFQNRRMKWRNSKERELLASGGSRDQTLPNKNNPNPDLSDAKCDRPISPLSPAPSSPPAHSLSPQPKEECNNAETPKHNGGSTTPKSMQSPASTPALTTAALQSPPLMHHIPSSVAVAAAAAAVAFSSASSMQMSSPPPLLTGANKLNANLNDQSSNASSSTASSPPHMTSAEFQAKINAEMQKHLAAADLKFKLESTINEAKQRRINMLNLAGAVAGGAGGGGVGGGGEQHALQLHSTHPGSIFMSEALSPHLQATHNHHHQQHSNAGNGMHLPSSPMNPHSMPPFQNPEFMKMYYDDYDDSNSDSDEEISVT